MKSVLLSIKPEGCELIASGKKTVEIRKNRPKIDTPFKCYIYCTKPKQFIYSASMFLDELYRLPNGKIKFGCSMEVAGYENYPDNYVLNSKVIGEFVCYEIGSYECEFVDDDCYEEISEMSTDEDGTVYGFIEWSNNNDFPYERTDLFKKSCVEYNELKKYIGIKLDEFYAWHISDLVIYDKPKELSEFYHSCNPSVNDGSCYGCRYAAGLSHETGGVICENVLTRPPQSWCYVEELEDLK